MSRPLLVVLALTLAAAAGWSLGACGKAGRPDAELVRAAVNRFARASARKDYQQICDRLVSRRLVQTVEQIGLPCESAFRRGLRGVRRPRLQIRKIQVAKDKALVSVRSTAANQKPSDDTLQLVKEDGKWKIAALAKPQPQPPARTTP
jgi:putative lumazine-binding protein